MTVSPKRRVAVMTAIFAAFGIGVSAVIIAAGGGFSGQGGDIFHPPTNSDIWVVGSQINNGTTLEYALTDKETTSELDSARVGITFVKANGSWQVHFNIVNGTAQPLGRTITMSNELTPEGGLDESFRQYFEPIQASIFHVRDM